MCQMKQEVQFSKNTQIITVCYSTCVRIEMKQEGQFPKKQQKHQFITVCYSTRGAVFQKHTIYYCMLFNLCAYLKWNKRGGFQKNPIDENMLLNLCAKWNRRAVCKKQQFITVCYSTCVRIEMKQEG